jgi:hypothetical protein
MLVEGDFSSKFGVFTNDGLDAPNTCHVENICSTILVCPLGRFVGYIPFCYYTFAVVCMDDTPSHCMGYCGVTISIDHEFGIPTHLGNICGVAMGSIPS